MDKSRETVIATLPGQNGSERLEVVLMSDPVSGSRMQLRQQSWGDGVGWFTQSSVELEPSQLAELKLALGSVPSSARPTASLPGSQREATVARPFRLVRADSA